MGVGEKTSDIKRFGEATSYVDIQMDLWIMNYTKQISCDRKKHNYIRQGFTVADLEANKSSRTGMEKNDCGELQSSYI